MTEDKQDDCSSTIKKANPWLKFAIGILSLTMLIGGVLWGMTSTFAMKSEVKTMVSMSVQTFGQFQKQLTVKSLNDQIESSLRREKIYRYNLFKDPNSNDLRENLKEEIEYQKELKKKRDNILLNK